MSASEPTVRIEDLLAHRPWVRTLAVALTRDENDAEDVQQQTWLVALRSPPHSDASIRGWLGTVARNVVRTRARRAEVRSRHVAAVARVASDASQDPAELTARAELHAKVTAAVVALDEPYRLAILLRHFEDLPVAEVARTLGAPLETTRARLRRGRARLREQLVCDLGRDRGDERPLAVLLLPLLREKATTSGAAATSAAITGGALMTGKVMIAATAVLVLLALGWWWSNGGENAASGAAAAADTAAISPETGARPAAAGDLGALKRRSRVRAALVSDAVEDSEPDDAADPRDDEKPAREPDAGEDTPSAKERLSSPIDEMVFDNDPLRDILGRISWHADVPIDIDVRAVSAIDEMRPAINGQNASALEMLRLASMLAGLEFEVLTDRVVLRRSGDEWTDGLPVQRIAPNPAPTAPEAIPLQGRVVSQDGTPIAQARISGLTRDIVRTGPDGSFSARIDPGGHSVVARATGYLPSEVVELRPPYDPTADVEIVLGPAAARVSVVVTGPEKTPLRRALVRLLEADGSGDVRHTDAQGIATFSEARADEYTLRVEARGHAPAVRTLHAVAEETVRIEVAMVLRSLAECLREERTTLEFDDEYLSQIVASLYRRWGVTVRMGPDVPYETSAKRVTLRIPDASLDNALRAICSSAGVTFRLDEEREIVWVEAWQ